MSFCGPFSYIKKIDNGGKQSYHQDKGNHIREHSSDRRRVNHLSLTAVVIIYVCMWCVHCYTGGLDAKWNDALLNIHNALLHSCPCSLLYTPTHEPVQYLY